MFLDIYEGADGTTVGLEFNSISERDQFVAQLKVIADGQLKHWTVQASYPPNGRQYHLMLAVVDKSFQEILIIGSNDYIVWRRTFEGWLECAELLEALDVHGCQYLSQNSADHAVVEVLINGTPRVERDKGSSMGSR